MRKLSLFIVITLLFCCLQIPCSLGGNTTYATASEKGADKYADKLRLYEEFVRKQMALDHTPGLTVGFIKDDYVWVKGFGYADLENKTPTKADSSYRLASITKSMTAVAVLQLAEQGKVNLDAEVQTYGSGCTSTKR